MDYFKFLIRIFETVRPIVSCFAVASSVEDCVNCRLYFPKIVTNIVEIMEGTCISMNYLDNLSVTNISTLIFLQESKFYLGKHWCQEELKG